MRMVQDRPGIHEGTLVSVAWDTTRTVTGRVVEADGNVLHIRMMDPTETTTGRANWITAKRNKCNVDKLQGAAYTQACFQHYPNV